MDNNKKFIIKITVSVSKTITDLVNFTNKATYAYNEPLFASKEDYQEFLDRYLKQMFRLLGWETNK